MITGTAGEERKGRCSRDSETEPNTKTSVEKTSMSKNLKQVKGHDSFQEYSSISVILILVYHFKVDLMIKVIH